MPVKPRVGHRNELPIKPLLAYPRFIAGDQQNGFLARVEGEGDPPWSAARPEAQFLHVLVLRSMKSIGGWPPELRSKRFQQIRVCEQFVLNFGIQCVEFRLELCVEIHLPRHAHSMACSAYVVNNIWRERKQPRF
jgi:hypothetical protein